MFALFCTNPYYGHFHPMVSLAEPLRAAGHEVAFATTESFREVVTAAGFPTLPAGTEPFTAGGWDDGVMRRKAADLLDIARGDARPDLVVREITDFGSLVAAEVLGIPHVTVGGGVFIDADWWRRLLGGSLNRIRESYGLSADVHCGQLHRYLYADLVPAWFQHFTGAPPPTHQYFRVDRPAPPDGPAPAWLAELPDRPTVYVTFGTVYNKHPRLLRMVLDALRDEPVNVICTTGADQDPGAVFPTGPPPNARVERYVPQGHLLPRCSVIISHGGYSTLLGALRHNVLPLVIPFGSDQPLNAQRCADLGIGLRLRPARASEAAVRRAATVLLHAPERRERLRRLRDKEAAVPAVAQAVPVLERLAASRRPALVRVASRARRIRRIPWYGGEIVLVDDFLLPRAARRLHRFLTGPVARWTRPDTEGRQMLRAHPVGCPCPVCGLRDFFSSSIAATFVTRVLATPVGTVAAVSVSRCPPGVVMRGRAPAGVGFLLQLTPGWPAGAGVLRLLGVDLPPAFNQLVLLPPTAGYTASAEDSAAPAPRLDVLGRYSTIT
jgi:UDP:flavonoid glycosyltransferase YjiC (YdhE family)